LITTYNLEGNIMRRALASIIISCFLCCFCQMIFFSPSVHAAGTTLFVGGFGDGNYSTIQEAVNAANDGDTIYVYDDGSPYIENVLIDKSLTLQGENRDTTIIQGASSGHVLQVFKEVGEYVSCSLSGFTIQGASGEGNDCVSLGYVDGGTVSNLVLKESAKGDGLQLDHCLGITISNNNIYNSNNLGISLISSSDNTVFDNYLQDHIKNIELQWSFNNVIRDNTITMASDAGIMVDQSCSGNIFYHNDFTDNGRHGVDGGDDTWYSQTLEEGNYWDDYTGSDRGDGIGDIPYEKHGVLDEYPLGYFVQQNQRPTATILSISPSSATYGQTITFRGSGSDDGEIIAYYWTSDIDGFLSSQPTFSADDLQIGTHLISFKVRDDEQEWSLTKTQTITVIAPDNEPPLVTTMTINPQQADYGDSLYFYGDGVDTDPTGSIVGYIWTSSLDGAISTQRFFNCSNLSVGTHVISFKVMDNKETWSEPMQKTVIIRTTATSSNQPPTALSGGPYTGEVNSPVFFDGSASYDSDGTIQTYSWEFGDGETSNGIQVGHTYTSTGNYTLILQVTDNNGTKSTHSTTVSIYAEGQLPDNPPDQNNTDGNQNGFSFPVDIEPTLLIPLLGVLMFIGIFGGFILWMKRS